MLGASFRARDLVCRRADCDAIGSGGLTCWSLPSACRRFGFVAARGWQKDPPRKSGYDCETAKMTSGKASRRAKSSRTKRQHVAPAMYLGAWANDRNQVRARTTGASQPFLTNVSNVAVRSNFYDIKFPDGTSSDMVETAMARIEGEIKPALDEIRSGCWPLSAESRAITANFIALQIGRGPSLRASVERAFDEVESKGRAMRDHMRELQDNDPDEYARRAEMHRRLNPVADGPAVPIDALPDLRRALPLSAFKTSADLVSLLASHTWTLLESNTAAFVTSDQPVALWPPKGLPAFLGVGIMTAERLTIPISPRLCLELRMSVPDDEGLLTPGADQRRSVSPEEVAAINRTTARGAHSHVIFAPGHDIPSEL
jgi:hypothetical protein